MDGGESDLGEHSEGSGGGFGLMTRPVRALVIRDGKVRWKPTIDYNRVIMGSQVLGLAYFLCTLLIARGESRTAVKIAKLARG